nr:hypothetical protein T08G3.9 - Caenorhabditis elegans [Caenorhabditis elegans]
MSLEHELPVSAIMSKAAFRLSILSIFSVSSLGLLWNVFLFWKLMAYNQLNYVLNRIIGALSATWVYFLNSLVQICMACNRFYFLFFPFGIKVLRPLNITKYSILLSFFISICFVAMTFPKGCGYVYDPNYFSWRGEDDPCSERMTMIMPPVNFLITIITNGFNIGTAIRLLTMKNVSSSDCLQLIDTFNSFYIYKLNDSIWFQFVCLTLSLVTICALDGLVMLICNHDCHPSWLTRIKQKKSSVRCVSISTINNAPSKKSISY